jgi:hypothetical protein
VLVVPVDGGKDEIERVVLVRLGLG